MKSCAYDNTALSFANFAMAELVRPTEWHQLIRNRPLAVALGLLSHYILNNGEWDRSSHLLAIFSPVAFCTLAVVEYMVDPHVNSIITAVQVTATTATVYLGALLSSLLIYRAFFHRLRKVSRTNI
jgi:hypothetical protein